MKCVELGTRQKQEKCANRIVLLKVLWRIANCMHPAQHWAPESEGQQSCNFGGALYPVSILSWLQTPKTNCALDRSKADWHFTELQDCAPSH